MICHQCNDRRKSMTWKAEVIADNSGKWCGNGLRFDTKAAAETYVLDLASRWTSVRDWRVVEAKEGDRKSVV